MDHIIYLHGFLSSPKSEKAQLVSNFISIKYPNIQVHMPTLSGNPDLALETVENLISRLIQNKDTPIEKLLFIGSSMGGYLSTYFVETYGGKAVLINPAVEPFELIEDYKGLHTNPHTGEVFTIDQYSVDKLRQIYKKIQVNDPKYLVFLQKGDEVLDYRLAEKKYGSHRCNIENGGNHGFLGLENHLNDTIEFLLQE
ncbi:YqiA/YcfP family alpha/beta fold hydrolase [Glaciecola sp. MF2-115]|uniref:YqiA/YcfP family alpha/beta fold hydrolase n=1 Tax=Glaciecola sp. MF2-115 TaxID=3384827 RepID=UPI00399F7D84